MLFANMNGAIDSRRFISFFNAHSYSILKDLYEQDKQDKIFSLKVSIIKENIDKSNDDLLEKIKKLDYKQEYQDYYESLLSLLLYHSIDECAFQQGLEKINEKSTIRKDNGVYYTPEDVSSFIILNSINLSINKKINNFLTEDKSKVFLQSQCDMELLKDRIIDFTIFDPTCGTGAFLVKAFDLKISLLKRLGILITTQDVLSIIKSLYGNDIDSFSTYITQTRLMFKAISISSNLNVEKLLNLLMKNFYNFDFLNNYTKITKKFDFVIGNPPYVEKSKVSNNLNVKYGNIYADVIQNSFSLLKNKGVLGYIIPISYTSTPRFAQFRKFVEQNTSMQYVLSYADRPDCLFSGVHQKLNIIIAKKENIKTHKIYTSDYKYWYKSQRNRLFDNVKCIENKHVSNDFYPKLGNMLEESIYRKITNNQNTILSCTGGDNKLYLNMRATFWIKSFIEAPYKSKEYKEFVFDDKNIHLINVILNSSLFWWFWVKVSDCWHITSKELTLFTIPDFCNVDYKKVKKLSIKLNELLEETKEKVDTKQTLYEYKHRKCKYVIDELDEFLATLYHLTNEELKFIKTYNECYRVGIDNQ